MPFLSDTMVQYEYCITSVRAVYIVILFFFRLKGQLPDIKTSLGIVKHMQSKKVCHIIYWPLENGEGYWNCLIAL